MIREVQYVIYPSWFTTCTDSLTLTMMANAAARELADFTAAETGWSVRTILVKPDGLDYRGNRMAATVYYDTGSSCVPETPPL